MGRPRRGFNLVELLIALAITAALMAAVMVALRASFMAYQATTEVASTHTISRLIMSRMLTMIRTGSEFGPYPVNPLDTLITSDEMQFKMPEGEIVTLTWREDPDGVNGFPVGEALYVTVDDGVNPPATNLLLEGVKAQYDSSDPPERIKPFTLFYEKGKILYRATIDLAVVPDDNMSVELDGQNTEVIRLVASAMPRMETRQ
jgi:prepilin-type N-terminal cleavage/methylation domain-containing protein